MDTKNADLSSLKINRSNKENAGTGKSKIGFIIAAAVIILLVIGYFVVPIILSRAVEVRLSTAVLQKPGQTAASLNASGYVVAQRKAAIASKGTGRLIYLGVVEGDKVKKDQIIAQLENTDILAQLDEAKANLKLVQADLINAENTFDRERELFNKG